MVRILFAIIFLVLSANAAYQSTEIVKVVRLKVAGEVVGLRLYWEVVDDFHPKVPTADNPKPQAPINGIVTLRGANYTAFQNGNAAQKKALLWSLIRPDVQHFYKTQAQQPAPAEEEDAGSPIKGELSTQQP